MLNLILSDCKAASPYDLNCCDNKVGKCGENEGDCDDDSHCKNGLICAWNSCPIGNGSNFNYLFDCCKKPSSGIIVRQRKQALLCSYSRIFIIADTCFKEGKYVGYDIGTAVENVYDAESCQKECQKLSECQLWTYSSKEMKCYRKTAKAAKNEPEKCNEPNICKHGPRFCQGKQQGFVKFVPYRYNLFFL